MDKALLVTKSLREVLSEFGSDEKVGLSEEQVSGLLKNNLKKKIISKNSNVRLFLRQFKSSFMALLIIGDILSFFLGEKIDAIIILAIIFLSAFLSFLQERGAKNALEKLLDLVRIKASVIRSGKEKDISAEEVVKGDIILLNAGDVIPADCLLIESKDLYINESVLTGESFSVLKFREEKNGFDKPSQLFKGTHVASGYGKVIAIATGPDTEFGKIEHQISLLKEETEFERGLRKFGYFLMQISLTLIFVIFALNIYFGKPFIDSLLFSLSLSIGMTPFLLPAIVSVNLAYGSRHMAAKKVIVKRLASIENFGSMNVFCSDKTGTLTLGEMKVSASIGPDGKENAKVFEYAYLNALSQTGYENPIDDSIKVSFSGKTQTYTKRDEKPYDFVRKCLSVLIDYNGDKILITKGAFKNILDKCTSVEINDKIEPIYNYRKEAEKIYEEYSNRGFRIVGVAYKNGISESKITSENDLIFLGLLMFNDPLKEGVKESVHKMRSMGIRLKILTGDNKMVSAYIGKQLDLNDKKLLTGSEINNLSDESLKRKVNANDIFAELNPMQKERIVRLLSKSNNVVGYIGDGINDVSALHAADVGISVNNAVDVAKNTADIILLEKNLDVLIEGIMEGRRTFINTIKYIFMTSSANFGNVISMSIVSIFLPFLPLLPKQLLASNFLTDLPAMAIPSDRVDEKWIETPKKWNLSFIKKFMIRFGLLSSVFDMITFIVLLFVLKSTAVEFRSGWFLVTILTEFVVLWVLRSKNIFYKSKPGKLLFSFTLLMFIVTFAIPYTALGGLLEIIPLPFDHVLWLMGIVIVYAIMNEILKKIFYKKIKL